MSTIQQQFAAMGVQLSDLIPVFVAGSQTTRRITVAQLLEFIDAQQPANQSTVVAQYAAPTSDGFTVQIYQPTLGGPDTHLFLTPVADYPTGTLVLPPVSGVFDGQQITVSSTKAVGALTISPSGALSIQGAPGSMAANDVFTLVYAAISQSWFMVSHSVQSPVTTDTPQTLSNKTLVNAALGTPLSGNLSNCVGLPVLTGISGLGAGIAAFLNSPSSANLQSAITDETGSGLSVFNNAPVFIAPRLGTPFSGDLSNCVNLPILTGVSGLATAMAAFLANPTSANLAATMTDETGSGANVFARSASMFFCRIDAPSYGAPVTKTAAFTLLDTENWIICNGSASITATLPAASTLVGRMIMMKNIAAFTVVSASANVVPLAGGAAGTAIMPATAGSKVTLVSDGTNWITMA